MNNMDDIISVLQDLHKKQEKTKSVLAMKRQSLCAKIEDNFEVMVTQLKRSRESELRMVENALAETEEDIKVNIDATNKIIEELRKRTGASGREMDLEPAKLELKSEPNTEQYNRETNAREILQIAQVSGESSQDYVKRNVVDRKLPIGQGSELYRNEMGAFGFDPNMPHADISHYKSYMAVQSNGNKSGRKANKLSNVKYSVKMHGTFNIRTTNDTNVCDINGICCLENGGTVLVDTKNARLKVLDSNFNVVNATENCDYIRAPFGICHLRDEKFVFTDNTRSASGGCLKYMSIDQHGNTKYIKAFSTGVKNWSVVSKGGYLYVIGMQKQNPYYHIKKYTENGGALLGGLGIKGEYMCFNYDKSTLYVTRGTTEEKKSNNVAIVDHDDWFHNRCTFWHPDLNVPCGVVVDEYDQVLVCGFASKNVLLFDKDGNKIDVLLEGEDALNGPKAPGYDKLNHRLIVAGNTDIIKVFNLKQ